MAMLLKFPRIVLKLIMKILFFLDARGIVPYSLVKTDPCLLYTSPSPRDCS